MNNMGKLELNLPNYVVAKLKKGVRKKESGPYYATVPVVWTASGEE